MDLPWYYNISRIRSITLGAFLTFVTTAECRVGREDVRNCAFTRLWSDLQQSDAVQNTAQVLGSQSPKPAHLSYTFGLAKPAVENHFRQLLYVWQTKLQNNQLKGHSIAVGKASVSSSPLLSALQVEYFYLNMAQGLAF